MSGLTSPGRLHVITDEEIQSRFTHEALVDLAARGGAETIQLREKRPRSTAALVQLARRARAAARAHGARLVVNDRVDVALAAEADGVHLGREDLEPGLARRWLDRGRLVGVTLNSLEEAHRLRDVPVDYFGVGPVFGTSSKRDPAPRLGLDGLAAIACVVRAPLIAIGNITPERVAAVLEAGAFGVAVLSAVVTERDPAAATSRFREALEQALEARNDDPHLARTR